MENINPFFINSRILFKTEIAPDFHEIFHVAGNTGNCYITYSLIKEIFGYVKEVPHIPLIRDYDFSRQEKDIEYINTECSHVFLILQDQIRAPEEMNDPLPLQAIMNFAEKLNKPLIVAGFGANVLSGFDSSLITRLSGEMINFLKFLSDHCECIGVRGYFTEELFHKLGIKNVQTIGCPSFYETGPHRVIKKANILPKKIADKSVLTSAIPFYLEKDTVCCLQDEYDIVRRIYEGDIFLRYHKNFFFSPSIDDWKNFMKNFLFAYGSRVHGSILAINSGVPAIVMNRDARSREMCEFMRIPHLSDFRERKISDLFARCHVDEMNNSYPELYEEFKNFMRKNHIEIAEPIENAVNNCPDFNLYAGNEISARDESLVRHIEKIQDDLNYLKKYPRWLIRLLCLFVPKAEKRFHIRKKYSR